MSAASILSLKSIDDAVISTTRFKKDIWNETKNENEASPGKTTQPMQIFSELDCEKGMPDLDTLWQRLVIVTAFSENHAREAMWMLASAQKHMPNKRTIVYDLGITDKTLLKVG